MQKRLLLLAASFVLCAGTPMMSQKIIEASPETWSQSLSSLRKAVKNQKQDVVVKMHEGTYFFSQPLLLDESYGGHNGYSVAFKAAEGEKPVISGGCQIQGWERISGNLYKAPFNYDQKLRTLLVNGQRARMAAAKERVDGLGVAETFEITGSEPWAFDAGVGVDALKFLKNADLSVFRNPEDVEIVQNKVWTEKILCPREMDKWGDTIIVRLQQPLGAILNSLAWAGKIDYRGKFLFRNAYELLDEPGEFYFDRQEKMLYYCARRGEDMSKAVVIAPMSEGLVHIHGSSLASRVENISFEGITFSYDAWNLMNIDGSHGFGGIQSLGLATKYIASGNWHPTKYNSCDVPFGCIDISNAKGIRIVHNRFEHLGCPSTVFMVNDVSDTEVTGNYFNDILGNAVTVGHPQHYEIGDGEGRYSQATEGLCHDILISNNYVRNVCLDFRQIEAMLGFFVKNVTFTHNDIQGTPYGAIALGWWWGNAGIPESEVAGNNTISYNYIGRTHQLLSDGGEIYLLGKQPGSVIEHNYLFDGPRCIYPDDGSSGWRIHDNFINSNNQLWYHQDSDRNYDIRAYNNYVKTNRLVDNGNGTTVEGTHIYRNIPFGEEALAIQRAAGIEAQYKDIVPMYEPFRIRIYPEYQVDKW